MWGEMKVKTVEILKSQDVRLCGDGRCDSPGFCARYLTYILMDQFLDVVVDLEVMDCRQAGGISTTMEAKCFKTCLERVCENLKVWQILIKLPIQHKEGEGICFFAELPQI